MSCEFTIPFFSHVYTLRDIDKYVWYRDPVSTVPVHTYVFFSRVDPNVTLEYLYSEDNGLTYKEKWKKTGKDIDRILISDQYVIKLIMTGVGTIAFTEAEATEEFCGNEIYPFNYGRIDIEMTDSYSVPSTFPILKKGKEFCVLYANADEYVDIFDLQKAPDDDTLYTYGYTNGNITKNLSIVGQVDPYKGYSAACFYFHFKGDYSPGRKFMLNATSHLYIEEDNKYPPLFNNQTSFIKTPTQSRKVHLLTDNPNATEEITKAENIFRRAIVRSPLSHREVATVATTATVSVGMIIAAIVLFIIYIHSKTRKLKEVTGFDFDGSDSRSLDTSEYSYSLETYYESYYTYSDCTYSYSSVDYKLTI